MELNEDEQCPYRALQPRLAAAGHRAGSGLLLYLPQQEYITPCTFVVEDIKLDDILVVCEYADVFPDNLPRLPPDRDIEFVI